MSPTSCRCSTPRPRVYAAPQWAFGDGDAGREGDGEGFGLGFGLGLGLGLGCVVTRYVFSLGLA